MTPNKIVFRTRNVKLSMLILLSNSYFQAIYFAVGLVKFMKRLLAREVSTGALYVENNSGIILPSDLGDS